MEIQTTHGLIDESLLDKREHLENGHHIVEYYLGAELVHRSVQTGLTPLDPAGVASASFG